MNENKIAFALYDGFSMLELAILLDGFTRSPIPAGWKWDLCARSTDVYDAQGLHFYPSRIAPSLAGYTAVVIPGGQQEAAHRPGLIEWLASARDASFIAATGGGVLLAAGAGLARGRRAAACPADMPTLSRYGVQAVDEPWLVDGPLATASGISGVTLLAAWLRETCTSKPSGAQKPSNTGLVIPVTGSPEPEAQEENLRRAVISRKTGETQVEVSLDVDGTGAHNIDTGLPFLDHMLAQVAVHGLFNLSVQAKGDLHIDPHHTLEDVALTIGSAFQQALGERTGIVRMASADCPMDESLAWVAVDFSGRPYCVFQCDWHGPTVGGLPVSLFAHFFESFALNARCNLHAAVRYGRDDHHQAEALFKALGRALCAATRIDPRRAGRVPSSKGVLF